MIVVKFGGSTLESAEGIERACREIRSLPRPLVVVVSAISDVTNRLEHLAETALSDPVNAMTVLDTIATYHEEIARKLLSDAAFPEWKTATSGLLERLREVIEGVMIVRELSARTLDLIVHFGERLSSSLLLSALYDSGQESVTGISALDLLITDAMHRHAHVNQQLTYQAVERLLIPALDSYELVVTEGYISRSADGQVTTMGRESSDYTAALLGQLLNAHEVRIYTGVSGILTADPRVIPQARTITGLQYNTARILAELGVKVLHPRTVTPVETANIPLIITALDGHATRITEEDDTESCSVVLLSDAMLVSAETASREDAERFVRDIHAELPVVWQYSFRHEQQIVVSSPYNPTIRPTSNGAGLNIKRTHIAVVSLVRQRGLATQDITNFFQALAPAPILAVHTTPEGYAISAALPADSGSDAAKRLHIAVVEQ